MARLSSLARQQGFDSREDFLRDIIERVAFEEFQFESEVRYQLLVSQYNQMQEWTVEQIGHAIATLLSSQPKIESRE
ncbi:hypothetical protein [Enterococcus sp. HY326]|uniref:hypothetical protein n=1 Tax=Enterococcus sp. HY326 TaxID=2971265 RepID=UPI0022401FA7|nr:hypothetical protein [Enterococcus sp. HY326]